MIKEKSGVNIIREVNQEFQFTFLNSQLVLISRNVLVLKVRRESKG